MSETRGRLTVRRGTVRDADTMLALFDDAVRWLTERGNTGQWGTAPFSAIPQRVQQVRGWGEAGALRVAERDGLVVAMSSVGPAPAYVSPATEPELYVMGLVGRRAPAARGAGRRYWPTRGTKPRGWGWPRSGSTAGRVGTGRSCSTT